LPPFDYYYKALGGVVGISMLQPGQWAEREAEPHEQNVGWRVVDAEFVTTDSGSGVVHQAPAFGEVDFDVLLTEQARFHPDHPRPELICAVGPDGKFTAEAPDFQGRWVKDCDKDIIRDLKSRGLLYLLE